MAGIFAVPANLLELAFGELASALVEHGANVLAGLVLPQRPIGEDNLGTPVRQLVHDGFGLGLPATSAFAALASASGSAKGAKSCFSFTFLAFLAAGFFD